MFVSVMLAAGGVEPGTAAQFDFTRAFSIQWWLQHLSDAYAENPQHMLTELCLVVLIFYLVFARQKTIETRTKLSAKEEQQLIDEWEPEPLSSLTNTPNNTYYPSSIYSSNFNQNTSSSSNSPNITTSGLYNGQFSNAGQFYQTLNNNNNSNDTSDNLDSTTSHHTQRHHHPGRLLIKSAMSSTVEAIEEHIEPSAASRNEEKTNDNNNKYIQFASHNYLGFANLESIKEKCVETIKKYAVGSCGPRGFYGTMDIHLNLEKRLSDFFSTNNGNGIRRGGNNNVDNDEKNNREAIIYADNIGCCASVITAFAKKGDLLLIDEGCHFLVTQGAMLSRANVIWYPHNDMKQLESYLQTVQEQDERLNRPLNRRYIVTEGLFHNHGDLCDLKTICALKNEYKYRLILDDSHGLGVLHPKGSPGYWGIDMTKIDIYLSSMDTALGSTGGFCVGDYETIYHQTLSGAGYVFSASAPPFQCTAAIESLNILESSNGEIYVRELQEKAQIMRESLEDRHGRWTLNGETISPLIHLRLTNNIMLNNDVSNQSSLSGLSNRNKRKINNNNNDNINNLNNKRKNSGGRNRGIKGNNDNDEYNNNNYGVYALFEKVCYLARKESNIIVFPSAYLPQEYGIPEKCDPKPSLRIVVTREHTKEQIKHSASVIKDLLSKLLNDGRSEARK